MSVVTAPPSCVDLDVIDTLELIDTDVSQIGVLLKNACGNIVKGKLSAINGTATTVTSVEYGMEMPFEMREEYPFYNIVISPISATTTALVNVTLTADQNDSGTSFSLCKYVLVPSQHDKDLGVVLIVCFVLTGCVVAAMIVKCLCLVHYRKVGVLTNI